MDKLIKWLDDHLVSNWREFLQWGSTWLQAVSSTIVGLFGGNAAMVALAIAGVTSSNTLRVTLIVGVAVVWFIGGLGIRLWDQEVKDDDSTDA